MSWEPLLLDWGKERRQEPEMERLPGVGLAWAGARTGKGWSVSRLMEEDRQRLPLATRMRWFSMSAWVAEGICEAMLECQLLLRALGVDLGSRASWDPTFGLNCKESVCNAGDPVWSLDQEDHLEEGMATRSSTFAWRIPWTEEPGGLQSTGSHGVGHDWTDLAAAAGPLR